MKDSRRLGGRSRSGGHGATSFGECLASSCLLVIVWMLRASTVILDGGISMTSLYSDRRTHGGGR